MLIGVMASLLSNFLFLFLKITGNSAFPPPLSAEEERKFFVLARQGDADARRILIERNLRLVAHIIKKYYTSCRDQEDLISIGTIGLIKAIDSYDINNGTRFATYAGKCLQNEILMYFRSQKKISNETSINEPIEVDKDGNPLTYMDIISYDDDIVENIDIKSKSELIIRGISTRLTEREKDIVTLRYGLGSSPPITQREVAKRLGISRSYVSRLEKSALDKLKEYINKTRNYI
ncbi:MAG: sigma-70 family RNA polymerase sigma factor [Ruminococcaceae bacterium]|nr:sigma-70 family RNA polymerase sigma factor [Oscillospiraceae bacterium]